MVVGTLNDEKVDRLFHALADATRRDIVRRGLGSESSVSALAANYDMSFAAVQKHVAVLESAGLVTKTPHGRERLVSTDIDTIRTAQELLDQLEDMWRERLNRIDALLDEGASQ
jgi:DNA-binding transcriptional ArsR family regulator